MKLNNTEDVELARCLLAQENLNLVVVKEGQTLIASREGGIRPLFEATVNTGNSLHGAAIADKIVGSTIALLCLYTHMASVYADIASTAALNILRREGVNATSKNVVPHILNYDGTDLCPFEKLAQSASSLSQLFSVLKSFFTEGKQ